MTVPAMVSGLIEKPARAVDSAGPCVTALAALTRSTAPLNVGVGLLKSVCPPATMTPPFHARACASKRAGVSIPIVENCPVEVL